MIFYIFCVWMLADLVVSGVFQRSYWKRRDVPLSQLYREAKGGKEIDPPGRGGAIGRVTRVGSGILMLLSIAAYFV